MINNKIQTNKNGKANIKTPLGLYYFICSKQGYINHEEIQYVNRNNNTIVFRLNKQDTMLYSETTKYLIHDNPEDSIMVFDEDKEIELKIENQLFNADTISINESLPLKNNGDFSTAVYSHNNVVFLLDVSTSMKYTGKLDLLKASMFELTDLLREVDQITLITYSSQTKVLLETTSIIHKDSIKSIIQNMKARGLTAGGRGLKLAYKNAQKSFINGGNNQVIIATDGDFNEGDENIKRLARKYKRKGIKLSVIGIKTTPLIGIIMKDLAQKGGGNYIPVNNYEDAIKSLVNEIKTNSYISFDK